MRRLAKQKPQREPTIALINIVFLMLVFFMVAGTLAQPLDPVLRLVETHNLDGQAPPNALVIYPDGQISYQGQLQTDPATFVQSLEETARETLRVVPDRNLPAHTLVKVARELKAAGIGRILIVTKRALE